MQLYFHFKNKSKEQQKFTLDYFNQEQEDDKLEVTVFKRDFSDTWFHVENRKLIQSFVLYYKNEPVHIKAICTDEAILEFMLTTYTTGKHGYQHNVKKQKYTGAIIPKEEHDVKKIWFPPVEDDILYGIEILLPPASDTMIMIDFY